MRDRSRRALCSDHLGSIYRGVTTYKAMFAGSLPFAGRVPGGAWLPGGGLDRPYASNSRHIYLLLKEHCDVQPRDFICPGGPNAEPLPANEWAMYDDFPTTKHISYASVNLAGPTPSLRPGNRLVYVSDPNPLFVNARFNADVDPDETNSPAHGGKGQTVLTLGGRVHWITTPLYGSSRDNLWLAGDIRRYTGVERPKSNDDAHLVPGFPASDPAVRRLRPGR